MACTGGERKSRSDIPASFCLFDQFAERKEKHGSTMTEGVSVYVCVLDEKGSWVFASRALVVVWTAVYLTGY